MKYGAVIVATYVSKRMATYLKVKKPGDMGFFERIVTNFRRAGVDDIVMVLGEDSETVEKELKNCGVTFLRDKHYQEHDMFSSASIGLNYISSRVDRVFFTPSDVPFFSSETVSKMMNYEADMVAPGTIDHPGHPILFRSSVMGHITSYCGNGGMRDAVKTVDREFCRYLELSDEGAFMGSVPEEEYRELIDKHNQHLLRPEIKVRLSKNRPFFGPGVVTLLNQIDSLGSVREACIKTGMSYSKGWSLVHTLEEELGYSVVDRYPGGKNGGTASVNEKGHEILKLYEEFNQKMNQEAIRLYDEIFDGGKKLER